MRKIISFMHISLDGFVAGPNGEMNRINLDEEIFDHVGKRISKSRIAGCTLSPAGGGRITEHRTLQIGVDYDATLKVHPNYKQGL